MKTTSLALASFHVDVPRTAEDRATTFRPVTGGDQMQSGERLLVEAYAAIWIVLFALILLGWRRQKRIDARVAGLEVALAAARVEAAEASSKKKAEAS